MVKLKNGVTGFIYDSCYGNVKKVITEPLTEKEIKLISEVLSEDDLLFTDNEDINAAFELYSKEDLENDVEGLNKVLEWVD